MPSRQAIVLAEIEKLEAQQINLGLYNTTIEAQALKLRLDEIDFPIELEELESLLYDLRDNGELIEWQPKKFRSRIAETVRCLRLLRRRFWEQRSLLDAPLLVDDIRVEFRERKRPIRTAVQLENAIPSIVDRNIADAFVKSLNFKTVSAFQKRAIEEIAICADEGNADEKSFIVAGDTGAGKTEAFLFPILLSIANEEKRIRQTQGVRAVLVYPRIRLARNQLARILRYTTEFHGSGGPQITVGIQNGDVRSKRSALHDDPPRGKAPWLKRSVENSTVYQIDLLENCINCENGRYWVRANDPKIDTGCPELICDNCGHRINNLCITQSALENYAPHILIITDVSLSQWMTREKYSHLWGVWSGNNITLPPRFLVLDEVHLYEQIKGAHVARIIKRFQARVRLAWTQWGYPQIHPITIGVSATLQNEERFLAKLLDVDWLDPAEVSRLKVIKPQNDELEPTEGRERYIFIYPRRLSPIPRNPEYRVDDQTAAIQIVMCAMHNLKQEAEWRGIAFFDSINDLRQFQHNYDEDPELPARNRQENQLPANVRELWRIRTDRLRQGNINLTAQQTFTNGCQDRCAYLAQSGNLNSCTYFRNGDCWIFARLYGHNERLQVAKSVYAGSAAELDGTDLIPTSPSLEVGYDDDAIQFVYQHKAPRNTASFIQRRGRAGRDPNDSPIIITLLWPYLTNDAFYFFHPEALYDPKFDDIPLNPSNFNVQRTHALLSFFDLVVCLRRQNIDGIASNPLIQDFTDVGNVFFTREDDIIRGFVPDDRNQKVLVKTPSGDLRFSGKQISNGHIRWNQQGIEIKGWLLFQKGLARLILREAWKVLDGAFPDYLSHIVTFAFIRHSTNPFVIEGSETLPSKFINQFGNPEYHYDSNNSNWVSTFKYIDWMLNGNEEATTVIAHYPNPNYTPDNEEEFTESIDVTFGLTELMPGNVSYRLRREEAIHWTPIPQNSESTYLYPQMPEWDDDGEITGFINDPRFLPHKTDITHRQESIFGVPRHIHDQFPGLQFLSITRLRVERFGRPDDLQSQRWYFIPDNNNSDNGFSTFVPFGSTPPQGSFPISRRSTVRPSSAIIPFVAGNKTPLFRQLIAPLNRLFAAISGYMEEGASMLGYTRIFHEMEITVKGLSGNQQQRLQRYFYPPDELAEFDEAGHRKPILVGYTVETQGIEFQINSSILEKAINTILEDEHLRIYLRRKFVAYDMAPRATEWQVFIQSHLKYVEVVVDYWLHEVIPNSSGQPRFLTAQEDQNQIIDFFENSRITISSDVDEFRNYLQVQGDAFYTSLNNSLALGFQDTSQFRSYLRSVLLHSLMSLLKKALSQLGGVGESELVAYADLPVMENVDSSIEPRIMIMDAVEGGSGGIAQAFERLDLTASEGSLWWQLLTQLGECPIAQGEQLTKTVMAGANQETIEALQTQARRNSSSLHDLLQHLLRHQFTIYHPTSDALHFLSKKLFGNETQVGLDINQAKMLQELFATLVDLEQHRVGAYIPREEVARHVARNLDRLNPEEISRFEQALRNSMAGTDTPERELAMQLFAIFEDGCEDGCPVCMGTSSDVENYYLVEYLNSRRALKKLREVLLEKLPEGSSVVELGEHLVSGEAARIDTPAPDELRNKIDTQIGIGVVIQTDEVGQASISTVIATDTDQARESLIHGNWDKKWDSPDLKPYMTPQGVRVRSRAEHMIASTLEAHNIGYDYEARLAYRDASGKTKYLHPDFHLYEHDLYVEFWGFDEENKDYMESRKFKEQVYEFLTKERGLRIMHLEASDLEDNLFWEKILHTMES